MPHRLIAHPADVGFEAWGPDLAAALDAAVRALAEIETGSDPGPGDVEVTSEIAADSDEALLVAVLEECLFLLDARDFLATGARVTPGSPEVVLVGRPFRPGDDGVHVKAITWHGLSVERRDDGVHVTVLLDI